MLASLQTRLKQHDPFPAAPVHFHRVEDSIVVMRSIQTPKKVEDSNKSLRNLKVILYMIHSFCSETPN